jgi:ParB/RepB/Spo0J family partition protein
MASLEHSDRKDSFTIRPEGIAEILDPLNLKFGLRDVTGLAKQIAEGGGGPGKPFQHTPVIVTKNKDGKTVLVAGRRRRAAIELINSDPAAWELPGPLGLRAVLYGQLSEEEILTIQISENRDREAKNSPMDDAQTAHILEERFCWSRERIAKELRIKPSRVRKLLVLMDQPERVRLAVHEGRLKESHAVLFGKLPLDRVDSLMDAVDAGTSPKELLAQLKSTRRSLGTRQPRTLAEARTALQEIGGERATNLLAWLDGDPTVGSLEDIFQ